MDAPTFQAAFPAFATTDVGIINAKIAASAPYFRSTSRWVTAFNGDFLNEGQGNWIACMLTWDNVNAATPSGVAVDGAVTTKHVGSVSVTRDGQILAKQQANIYLTNSYGRRYWQLLKMVGAGARTV